MPSASLLPCQHLRMRCGHEPRPLWEGDPGSFKAEYHGSPSSSRANKKTNTAEACLKAGVFFHFPCIPDPNLNPRTESCQPGCSRTDIAAGIFSAAFPQICLLLGRLKRTPRFLCYWMIHSVPSSKALGLPGGRKQAEGGRGLRCRCRAGECSGCAPRLRASQRGWAKARARGGQGQGAAAGAWGGGRHTHHPRHLHHFAVMPLWSCSFLLLILPSSPLIRGCEHLGTGASHGLPA